MEMGDNMVLVIMAVVALLCLFISIVNYYYQKAKYKYSTDQELKRLTLFEAPSTWGICILASALFFVVTFVLCGKFVMGGFSNMQTQENKYQDESSNQNTDN